MASGALLDHESGASLPVRVRVTDRAGLWAEQSITVSVTDVNEAPSFPTSERARSVPENAAVDTPVGAALRAADEDRPAQTLTYTMVPLSGSVPLSLARCASDIGP